jgi:predicted nucleic-acid-binding protein
VLGLDTNIVLRLLLDESVLPDSPEQTHLVSELVETSGETFFVSQVVVAEAVWVLRNQVRLTKDFVEGIIGKLLGAANLDVQDAPAVGRALASFLEGPGDFADHLIGAVNLAGGCRATLTFDRKLSKAKGFVRLTRS